MGASVEINNYEIGAGSLAGNILEQVERRRNTAAIAAASFGELTLVESRSWKLVATDGSVAKARRQMGRGAPTALVRVSESGMGVPCREAK